MNKQETAKILAVIKKTYPAFYYRQSEDDIKKSVTLWQSLFEDDDAVIVGAALKSFIVSDASGYPPTPGQIKEKMRLIMHPDRLSEADAWQAVKIAMRNPGLGEDGHRGHQHRCTVKLPQRLPSPAGAAGTSSNASV